MKKSVAFGLSTVANRPTAMTPERLATIYDYLERGNNVTAVAKAAGISPQTLRDWYERGRSLSLSTTNPTEIESIYIEFAEKCDRAMAMAEIRNVETLRKASADDPKWAAWWLERARPDEWGLTRKTEISGPDGSAINISLDPNVINNRLEMLIAQAEADDPIGDIVETEETEPDVFTTLVEEATTQPASKETQKKI